MLPKVYEPKSVENKWIDIWQKEKIFFPKIDKSKKPFTVVIPPPNITGALHMGHALNNTLQDILIRYKRMSGENAYWVVGTDHGGIATQNVLEKILKNEGVKKTDIGREKFLERMWKWYEECGHTILNQLKKLGCSIDFSKENVRFTMDKERAYSVFWAFKELWEKGLIYRGERMINWCPRCYTALSDIEVEYEEEKSKLWHIKYPIDGSDDFIVVATTRPETMLGDTAVAVNPEDKRYKKLIGKFLILPLVGRKIRLIADEKVEMGFGTGAVKVTPAHDQLDMEIGERHNLEFIKVISDDGKIINSPGKYSGLKVLKAREEIVKDLSEQGYLVKEEPYVHNVGKCYRCDNHIEPMISEQWFVKYKPISDNTLNVIKNGEVKFYPERWVKPMLDWLNNIQDWCISRQIWWGHRIPAFYCKKCSGKGLIYNEKGEIVKVSIKNGAKPIISFEKPSSCPDCGGSDFVQDPDVLDTWFSSALWPFSVFGWPKKTEELNYFYPTSALVTGYEILYLWVLRMITSGLFHLNQIPFSKVYVHGIVRDKHGQKMSKSKGNVIDPLDMMEKYGTDAMRFSLAIGALGGKDIPFSENSIIGGRNFVNKLYNVSRFIQMNLKEGEKYEAIESKMDLSDKWIISRNSKIIDEYKKLMDNYMLSEALDTVYGFVWDEFCDWYLEISKMYINTELKSHKMGLIIKVFESVIKMLHPFMPFVTEEIYSALKERFENPEKFIVDSKIKKPFHIKDEKAEADMGVLMEIIREIRTVRSEFSFHPTKEIVVVLAGVSEIEKNILDHLSYIKHLSKSAAVIIGSPEKDKTYIKSVVRNYEIYVECDSNIDIEKEKLRIKKEMDEIKSSNEKWEKMLSNKDFTEKAPESEVVKIKERVNENNIKISKLEKILSGFER
ncbi:MAG: valine--tRNA ligase [Elusimicrobiales bacterium]